MRLLFIPVLFLIATTIACTKSNQTDSKGYVTFSYKQTYCSDPWMNTNNDSLTLLNVANYLEASGLYVVSLDIKTDGIPQNCFACSCKTGKTIFVNTTGSEIMKTKFIKMGFTLASF